MAVIRVLCFLPACLLGGEKEDSPARGSSKLVAENKRSAQNTPQSVFFFPIPTTHFLSSS